MIKLEEQPEPPNFQDAARAAKDAVRTVFEDFLEPDVHAKGPEYPKVDDVWGNFKADLSQAYYMRCAYCEDFAIGTAAGDIEHYRPKKRIRQLNPEHTGREKEHLINISGRKYIKGSTTGYWWLAYEWTNYLLACPPCNQKWKSDLFPVKGDTNVTTRPLIDNHDDEVPLLINPVYTDPDNHLSFDRDGIVIGLTDEGWATIATVGLWRPSLVKKRADRLKSIELNIRSIEKEMQKPDPSFDNIRIAAENIVWDGDYHSHSNLFPGVIRNYFQRRTQMDWDTLISLANPLNS